MSKKEKKYEKNVDRYKKKGNKHKHEKSLYDKYVNDKLTWHDIKKQIEKRDKEFYNLLSADYDKHTIRALSHLLTPEYAKKLGEDLNRYLYIINRFVIIEGVATRKQNAAFASAIGMVIILTEQKEKYYPAVFSLQQMRGDYISDPDDEYDEDTRYGYDDFY